ncbi:hypothetical protein QTP70_015178 [Hemibagrus guttatus]|uniref:Reverse transcriptase/retrotransposon-derived protein RNase H-like domain-containing protein n=1 Tax=Hemibagrus guttatus TaxID=175788 RepID=A0AAE0R937_9TELE|nr:hypothetical protein QTP70_015178 [Hemibagrus guttatus]
MLILWGSGACNLRMPHSPSTSHVVALLDSGSAGNFISGALCRQLGLRTTATLTAYQIRSITGRPVSRRQVSRSVGPLLLQIGVLHVEEIALLVLEESTADVILGHPWLEQHSHSPQAEKCSFHQPSVQFLGYNIDSSGIRMDEGKVAAIRNWSTPTIVKELQRFLGFANFYRRFIRNYNAIANPLTSLLWNKPKSLPWTLSAEEVFNTLKEAFTTAPLLVHPDPDRPFIVEVDASMTKVGVVLSQQQGNPSHLHPCAFFSRKLNPVESNYDIGNRELLAVKLALEEWRHWLEGARHPFLVLTDHKNLEYL